MQKKLFQWVLVVIALVGVSGCADPQPVQEILYVGTYSGNESGGLYIFEFNREKEELNQIQTINEWKSPNFQTIHPNGKYLYSVSSESLEGNNGNGTVVAYNIDPKTGKLTQINAQSVGGRGPCHVSIDPKGRFAYVSNFSSGNLSVFKINNNGGLSEAVNVVQHEGSSVDEKRQTGPHVHSIIPSPDGRFIFASDMGIDKIMIYKVDQKTGELSPAEKPFAKVIPGTGPRHFTIDPQGNYAYSLGQMGSVVTSFNMDPSTGTLSKIQEISMLPEEFEKDNQAADIHISPDGNFLYASNRGHNSLVVYEINKKSGKLSLVGHKSTKGEHPRNFMIDKRGKFIIVANRDSNNLVYFRRDKSTGKLQFSGKTFQVPRAVCVTQYFLDH